MPRPDRRHLAVRRKGGRELATLFEARGKPATVVSDIGTEFTSNAILTFADHRKIDWHSIAPGKPWRTVAGSLEPMALNCSSSRASTADCVMSC